MSTGCLISGMVLATSTAVLGDSQEEFSTEVLAETPSPPTGLTGTWGGARDRLLDHGVAFNAFYAGEIMGNISGGVERGAVYEGLFAMTLDLDLSKLGLWRNSAIHVSSLYPHGRSPTQELVGDLLAVSNIDAWESFRLYQFWYEHVLFDGRFSFRIGQLAADEEFACTAPGLQFLNAGFGWPAFISANTRNTGPAYYVATLGARIRADAGESFYIQAGVFDGDSFDDLDGNPRPNESGTRIHLSNEQGAFVIGETGVRTGNNGGSFLPGEYKLGIWLHTGDFDSNYHDDGGDPHVLTGRPPRQHGGNHGIYLAAEQMFWREAEANDQGLTVFGRAGYSPPDRNLFSLVCDAGFTYHGLLPGRNADVAGVGMIYARISDDIRRHERDDRAFNLLTSPALPDHEIVLESTYSIQVRDGLTIQPDFQWIHHPGGSSATPDAFVIGLRTTIIF